MTIIVKNISSWVKALIVLFGIYVIAFGDLTPGGGFAGGVILASSYILLMLAFGREFVQKNLPPSLALKLVCCGALAFAAVAMSGLLYGPDGFFWNFIHQKCPDFISAGTIPLAEFAIGLTVAASLFLIIFTLSTCCKDFRLGAPANKKE
ncbi:hypothetical protein ES703_88004 [subsurface metagenome]